MNFIPNPLAKLWLIAIATFLAVAFGLVAITANPILIGLAVGSVVGVFMLAVPKLTIWLVIGLGLASPALLDMAGHGLNRMSWAISMLALLLWVPGIMGLVKLNPKHQHYVPAFIWLVLLFVVYAVIATVSQMYSIGEFFSGFKRYFQAYGLLLALAVMAITRKEFDRWLMMLLGLALLQLPFAIFERFILVPLRGGLLAGAEATDVVAGTMGANLQGGSPNAIMVLFVLTAFAFVFSRWKERVLDSKTTLWLSVLLLLPLVLGETKIVMVLLPLMGLVLLRKDVYRQPSRYLPMLIALFLITFALAYLYIYLMLESDFERALWGMISYNIGDVGYGELLLNRTTVFSFWWSLHDWNEPFHFLFGHGLGSSYGSGYSAGHIAQLYPQYGINLTTISTILWDLGVVGLCLYLSIFIVAWVQIGQLWKKTKLPSVKADCLALQSAIAALLMFTMYSDSQVNLFVHEIIVAVMMGYAAFMYRLHHQATSIIAVPSER